ncbi:MAG: formate dehydrogenase subunit delta [Paracoccus sp. (in: a-proteobacteria)]|uniref:formate dehydrogenase subunit delta n=1 Tax=Paracoccus sp. TaxID=267 RepID=UPI0026DFAA8B|nr:formate dehydrogenase subunit delta [Paracoccus sp. (in: a-proteobacteria)]MDO5612377.1 formate dehydrogenase subunit delta [Paracoccus sp. (in: a-proteobacteria)]MDO5633012.1 formate dehydrogenase subunit delta [Paracoccus sp. (in: a-proteobacteria)]
MADKLIRMATQIADFWRYQPGQPERAVAEHINDYWSYQMRRDFLAAIKGQPQADPVVQATAALIDLPDHDTAA